MSIEIRGRNNYAATSVTKAAAYKIRQANTGTYYDLSKARIVERNYNKAITAKEYTGSPIEPEIDVWAKPVGSKNEEIVDPSLYKVTYMNNVDKGNAVILVTPKSDTDNTVIGSREAKFSIASRGFARLYQLLN